MFESGELEANSQELDIDELIDEDPEAAELLLRAISEVPPPRNLQ